MRRVIKSRETENIGKCIYCGTTQGKLTKEHVMPLGFSGRLELLHASCETCATITGGIEDIVLGSMRAARAALQTKTRSPKKRKELQPMLVEKDGKKLTIHAPLNEHWKIIRLPIFPVAASLDGRTYDGGIESYSMDEFQLDEKMEDVAKRFGVDAVLFPEYSPEIFARFVAKVAYGYAVERYSLNAFEEIYVVQAILGETNDIGRWVGCPDSREFPIRDCLVSNGFKILPDRDLIVRLKLFPMFDGAEYVVVVGKMKEIYVASFADRIWHV